jgi:hypothetical protein
MEVSSELHALAALPPGKNHGTHRIGGWIGPRAGLDTLEKRMSYSCQNLNHRLWSQ